MAHGHITNFDSFEIIDLSDNKWGDKASVYTTRHIATHVSKKAVLELMRIYEITPEEVTQHNLIHMLKPTA